MKFTKYKVQHQLAPGRWETSFGGIRYDSPGAAQGAIDFAKEHGVTSPAGTTRVMSLQLEFRIRKVNVQETYETISPEDEPLQLRVREAVDEWLKGKPEVHLLPSYRDRLAETIVSALAGADDGKISLSRAEARYIIDCMGYARDKSFVRFTPGDVVLSDLIHRLRKVAGKDYKHGY